MEIHVLRVWRVMTRGFWGFLCREQRKGMEVEQTVKGSEVHGYLSLSQLLPIKQPPRDYKGLCVAIWKRHIEAVGLWRRSAALIEISSKHS